MSSYSIEPNSVAVWLDLDLKLPRFQRRGIWDEEQNFELCISVFQDYPIGVVVINKEVSKTGTTNWLLDGRQRRKALDEMHKNPVEVYKWAMKYIGFKKKEDPGELSKKYWDKVEKFLTKDESMNKKDDSSNQVEDIDANDYGGEETDISEVVEDSFSAVRQREGLKTLLDLILMVHQITKKKNSVEISRWESTFDFRDYFRRLSYAPVQNNYEIDPVSLRDFINKIRKQKDKNGELTEEVFCEYYLDQFIIEDKKEKKFKTEVNRRWEVIKNSIDVLTRTDNVFKDARIGVIWVTNASPLDAQNIFTRVNSGGTVLEPEELLSAKPFWNTEVNVTDNSILNSIRNLYEKLGVEIPSNTVRWDIPATLISRVDSNHIIFRNYASANTESLSMEEISMGFKLISSVFLGGMSKNNVNELEFTDVDFATKKNIPTIDWNNDINDLVYQVNQICSILATSDFFNTFMSWKKSISELMGNAIALEFLCVLIKDWNDRNRPTVDSAEMKAFKRDALNLFDRLVYEYGTKVWKGSGDSKMANDIKSWNTRVVPIDASVWNSYVNSVCQGEYNGLETNVKSLRPVIYYFYCLRDKTPLNENNVIFDVDHIIPQDSFVDNSMVDTKLKHSLVNLALLPKKQNIKKNDDFLK